MARVVSLLIVLLVTPGMAEDYLLTVERVEIVTTKEEEGHPKVETSRRTLEVLCRPGMPFLGRVIVGPETTTLAGELWEAKEERVRVEISFSHVVDTGMTVPTESGGREKITNDRSTHTTVEVEPGIPMVISRIISRAVESTDGIVESTEQTVLMTVREYKPAVEARKPDFLRG